MCLGSSNMPSESSPALPRLHLRQFVGLLRQKRPPLGPRPLHEQTHRLAWGNVPVSIAVNRGGAHAKRDGCRGAGQFLVRQEKLKSFRAKHDARFLAPCKEPCQTKNRTAIFFLTGARGGGKVASAIPPKTAALENARRSQRRAFCVSVREPLWRDHRNGRRAGTRLTGWGCGLSVALATDWGAVKL